MSTSILSTLRVQSLTYKYKVYLKTQKSTKYKIDYKYENLPFIAPKNNCKIYFETIKLKNIMNNIDLNRLELE